jgi:hypothetical protein
LYYICFECTLTQACIQLKLRMKVWVNFLLGICFSVYVMVCEQSSCFETTESSFLWWCTWTLNRCDVNPCFVSFSFNVGAENKSSHLASVASTHRFHAKMQLYLIRICQVICHVGNSEQELSTTNAF